MLAKTILKYSYVNEKNVICFGLLRGRITNIGHRNMIYVEIPLDCHVAFEGLQFRIISQLIVIVPSKEPVQK